MLGGSLDPHLLTKLWKQVDCILQSCIRYYFTYFLRLYLLSYFAYFFVH